MLADLLGSKNAERILLFLMVNEFGYASEMQKAFGISLTPLQSMIRKFEKTGLLMYEMQKKAKLYRFHPDYPLLLELKALLQQAFVHLPGEEKKAFFLRKPKWNSLKDHYVHQKRIARCLDAFWKRLSRVNRVSMQTQSGERGFGEVSVAQEKEHSLLFTEHGSWVHPSSSQIQFNNCLRWTIDWTAGLIALEHLRYGLDRPVFLFHLAPVGPHSLQSMDSHLCAEDCYFGRLEFTEHHIRFLWRTLGPRKNEIFQYIYTES
jgi:hypothetical protein